MISKQNGFSCPPHKLQIVTWLLGAFQASLSFSVVADVFDPTEQTIIRATFAVIVAGVLGITGVTTYIDPTDPVVYQHRDSMKNG